MQSILQIKKNLDLEYDRFKFNKRGGELKGFNFTAKDDLDSETLERIESVVGEYIDDYRLDINLIQKRVSVNIQ